MAFTTSGLKSPRDEQPSFSSFAANVRPIGSQLSSRPSIERHSLQRRFTTNTVPTLPTLSSLSPLSPIGQQRRQAAEPSGEYALKKRNDDLEAIRQRQRALQTEMALLNLQEDQLQNLESDISRFNIAGHQSEPTTPPEYNHNGFPNPIARPNRLSLASVSSLNGSSSLASHRAGLSGSTVDLTSPFKSQGGASHIHSVPDSRRGSDEDDDAYEPGFNSRRANIFNRMSMPVTNYDLRSLGELPDVASVLGTGLNSILSDEDEDKHIPGHSHSKSMIDTKSLLRMEQTHDAFPILVRDGKGTLAHSGSGLDLNGMQASDALDQSNGWSSFSRHRAGQQSLPMNTLRNSTQPEEYEIPSPPGIYDGLATKTSALNRRSLDVKYTTSFNEVTNKRLSLHASPPSGGMPKLQASYSTNDIPTLKNLNGLSSAAPLTHAEQHLQNHNATIGRIPAGVVNRLSRDLSSLELRNEDKPRNISSVLQANATPFGPSLSTVGQASSAGSTSTITSPTQITSPQMYNGFGYNMMNGGIANITPVAQQGQWVGGQNGQGQQYSGNYNSFAAVAQQQPQQQQFSATTPRFQQQDSQARVMHQRRQQTTDDNNRAANYKLEDVRGRILELCKDQHGCRFLQRKIEDHDPEAFDIIFDETKDHIVELMTDPFGNYLCQKLLEFSQKDRRTALINNAAPYMVKIALNQHGTRALQKMIEFVDSDEQISTIIRAFDGQVVTLIQDLNGNHVIQKCLNHLRPCDAQFIFDAVGQNCLIVGTHRHGCCVLQRCIDHAVGEQKAELIRYITANAYSLVQDPFGNYVVQYILDLNVPDFTQPLCLHFQGRILELSRQKFSSNVIEKCVRVADPPTRRKLIEELMLDPAEMERVLRDNFANYVIQTALDHADADQAERLWDIVIPLLGAVRGTPCGRRLMGKLTAKGKMDAGAMAANALGKATAGDNPSSTPNGGTYGYTATSTARGGGGNGGGAAFLPPGNLYGGGGGGAPTFNNAPQHHVHHQQGPPVQHRNLSMNMQGALGQAYVAAPYRAGQGQGFVPMMEWF